MQYSLLQNSLKASLTADMKGKCGNDLLEQKLIPPWSVGCRRLTPGYNYLEVRNFCAARPVRL